MAISYPLSLSQFWELCHFQEYAWDLMRFEASHQRKDGKIIATRNGTPKWGGSGALRPEAHIQKSLKLSAQFGKLRGSIGTFLAYDMRRPYPLLDPLGTLLTGFSPVLYDISVDRDRIRLAGLPNGYTISTGDYISIPHDGTFVLVRAMDDSVAISGTTPLFYVEDFIPLPVNDGGAVNLIKPVCVCRLQPGGPKGVANDAGTAAGHQLSWIQERVM